MNNVIKTRRKIQVHFPLNVFLKEQIECGKDIKLINTQSSEDMKLKTSENFDKKSSALNQRSLVQN